MKLNVTTLDAGKAGSIELSDEIFGIEEIRGDILQRCVVWQLAKRRAGTHKIKTRNEVARTGKKMGGHLGVETVTTQNLTIVRVDIERGLILVKGAVPGSKGSYVKVSDAIKKALPEAAPKPGAFRTSGSAAAPAAEAADTPAPEAVEAETTNEGGEA